MSFEEKLKQQTPSEKEISENNIKSHIERLKQIATEEIRAFKVLCEESAAQGKRNCSSFSLTWIDHGTTADDFHGDENIYVGIENGGTLYSKSKIEPKDADVFLEMLNSALLENEFNNATVKKHPIFFKRVTYKRKRGIFNVKVKTRTNEELVAEKFYISTAW